MERTEIDMKLESHVYELTTTEMQVIMASDFFIRIAYTMYIHRLGTVIRVAFCVPRINIQIPAVRSSFPVDELRNAVDSRAGMAHKAECQDP